MKRYIKWEVKMSYKNILQEYCQKHRLELPVYKSGRVEDNLWKSTCVCGTIDGDVVEAISNSCVKLKDSHQEAAFRVLNIINTSETEPL